MTSEGNLPSRDAVGDGLVTPQPLFVLPTSSNVSSADRDSPDRLAEKLAPQLAAMLELLCHLDASDRLDDAARIAARGVARWLHADRVVLSMCPSEEKDHVVIADTQAGDSSDPSLIAAVTEISQRGPITDSQPGGQRQRHSTMAIRQFIKQSGVTRVLGASFEGSTLGGAIAVIHKRPLSQQQSASQLAALDALRVPLANKLSAIRRSQRGAIAEFFRSLARSQQRRKQKWIAVACLLLVGVLSVPMRYHVAADCQLQPIHRRYIAAPVDGPLQHVNVRPGDTVRAGDLLASINPREIDFQLAAKQAERERLIAVYKGQLAQQKFADSKLTDLERQQVDLELSLLRHRKEHLEIRSPIDGIVIGEDLKRREGIPLSQGETLMEIAPLDKMLVEISVPEADLHHVAARMPATFQLYAVPGESFAASVDRVNPAAELIDHDNVFVADAEVTDDVGVLRPGMRGRAWIQSHRKPLAWILFHNAYYSARQIVGWW